MVVAPRGRAVDVREDRQDTRSGHRQVTLSKNISVAER
jgi:hypothetical protein